MPGYVPERPARNRRLRQAARRSVNVQGLNDGPETGAVDDRNCPERNGGSREGTGITRRNRGTEKCNERVGAR